VTVLSQPSSTTVRSEVSSETDVAWSFIRRTSEGRCEPATLSIIADSKGSIVATVTTITGHSVLDVFTTEYQQLTHHDGRTVRSWKLEEDILLRVGTDSEGHVLAVRSSLPSLLHLPGGTYRLMRSPQTT
jgi:hypothetical protein